MCTGLFGDYWKPIVMEGVYFWIYDKKLNAPVYALKMHRNNYANSIYSRKYTYGISQIGKFNTNILINKVFVVGVI